MVVYTKAWESCHCCKYCPILSVFVDFSVEPKAIIHLRKTLLCITLKCVWQFLFFRGSVPVEIVLSCTTKIYLCFGQPLEFWQKHL